MQSAQYKRVLLKLSGEALAGEKGVGIDNTVVSNIAKSVKTLTERFLEVVAEREWTALQQIIWGC